MIVLAALGCVAVLYASTRNPSSYFWGDEVVTLSVAVTSVVLCVPILLLALLHT